jgi:hypothetical protein
MQKSGMIQVSVEARDIWTVSRTDKLIAQGSSTLEGGEGAL